MSQAELSRVQLLGCDCLPCEVTEVKFCVNIRDGQWRRALSAAPRAVQRRQMKLVWGYTGGDWEKHQFIKGKFFATDLQFKLSGSPAIWSLTIEEGKFLNNSKIKLIKEAATKLQASPKYLLLMVLHQGEEVNMLATRGLRGGPVTGAYCFDCLQREAIKLRHRMAVTAHRAIGKKGKPQA